MNAKGTIHFVYPEGISPYYAYFCIGQNQELFRFVVKREHHLEILKKQGYPVGRRVEYEEDINSRSLRFID